MPMERRARGNLRLTGQHIADGTDLPNVLFFDDDERAPHLSDRAVGVGDFIATIDNGVR